MQYRFVLPLFLLLAGCQSQTQRFDGFTGYESSPLNDKAFLISYTEEAKISWTRLEGRAKQLCQQLLPEQKAPAVKVLRRDVFDHVIAKPIPDEHLVMGPLNTPNQAPSSNVSGGAGIPQHSLHMKMKKALIICEPAEASGPS